MALQSLWIRKNMLQSPNSDTSHQERQLSENEKRVLRSIEKLSIPEWYLNNNSRPPKILSNDTPIDQRPAAWKNMSAKRVPEPETPDVQLNNSTVCDNSVLETKIETSSNAKKNNVTDKANQNSPTKKSPVKQNVSPKNQNQDGSPLKLMRANISQTFPRMSPSRKIQHINIVFPQEMMNAKRLMITDLDDVSDTSVMDMTVDSLEVQKKEKEELGDTETRDSHGESSPKETVPSRKESEDLIIAGSGLNRKSGESKRKSPVCLFLMKNSLAMQSPKPGNNSSDTQKSQLPVRSCITVNSLQVQKKEKEELGDTETRDSHGENSPKETVPSRKESEDVIIASSGLNRRPGEPKRKSPVCLFLMKNSLAVRSPKPGNNGSEPQKSQLPVRSSDSTKKSTVDDPTRAKTSEKGSKKQAAPAPKKSGGVKRKSCGCLNIAPVRQSLGSGPRVSSFRPKSLLPSIPETEYSSLPERPEVYPSECPTTPLFNSTVNSVEVNEIEDADSSLVSQTSLASDIIEELNDRCSAESVGTYDSASSKNFVKKLVTALETQVLQLPLKIEAVAHEELPNHNAKETCLLDETYVFGENSSEDETNTVAMSMTISLKGSDSSSSSSGSTPGSPMIVNGNDPVYDWNSATHRNDELPKDNNEHQVVSENLEDTKTFEEDDDDDWMYWNQNSEWNYPRTSSRLSSVSSQSIDHTGPCISPIERRYDVEESFSSRSGISPDGWGIIYKTRKSDLDKWFTASRTKKTDIKDWATISMKRKTDAIRMWRLNGTIVLDSGYSDRSNSLSSSYTEETTSSNYTGTTLTASETSSYCHDDSRECSMSPIQPE